MDLEQFGRLLVRLGADLDGWPEIERKQARALIARSPEAARLLEESSRIDQTLRDAESTISPQSIERILAHVDSFLDRYPRAKPADPLSFAVLPFLAHRPWLPVAAMVLILAIGFLLSDAIAPADSGSRQDFVDLLAPRSMAGFAL